MVRALAVAKRKYHEHKLYHILECVYEQHYIWIFRATYNFESHNTRSVNCTSHFLTTKVKLVVLTL